MSAHDQGGDSSKRITPIPWASLKNLPKRKALIEDLLDESAMSIVFGRSGSGKTFFALDLALHVALGWDWREKKVRAGAVVYIAAEGGNGLVERIEAFEKRHNVDLIGKPFFVIQSAIDLCSSGADVESLLQGIQELKQPVSLIVVDTLSRALAGGDENSSKDMGAFVRYCDRIRQVTGAHLLIVHHTGKDEGRGARGHSLLRAAADTEIEITSRRDTTIARVTKQRDQRMGAEYGFKLEAVEIRKNDEGLSITSCVVVETDGSERPRENLSSTAKLALAVLVKAIDESGKMHPDIPAGVKAVTDSHWRECFYRDDAVDSGKMESKRKAIYRAIKDLQAAGIISIRNRLVWIVPS